MPRLASFTRNNDPGMKIKIEICYYLTLCKLIFFPSQLYTPLLTLFHFKWVDCEWLILKINIIGLAFFQIFISIKAPSLTLVLVSSVGISIFPKLKLYNYEVIRYLCTVNFVPVIHFHLFVLFLYILQPCLIRHRIYPSELVGLNRFHCNTPACRRIFKKIYIYIQNVLENSKVIMITILKKHTRNMANIALQVKRKRPKREVYDDQDVIKNVPVHVCVSIQNSTKNHDYIICVWMIHTCMFRWPIGNKREIEKTRILSSNFTQRQTMKHR